MSTTLSHRGPDGEGFLLATANNTTPLRGDFQIPRNEQLNYLPDAHVNTFHEKAVLGFAHRRLSIIDLSEAGHEPMCDHEGRFWLTFNGEIYNYRELAGELKTKGHRFRSACDAEVIIYAYKEWGTDCVQRFNGMWAFAIYDAERKIVFCSRDRLGVKPFYYSFQDRFFAFASEQKAFVRSGLIIPAINSKAMHGYLVNNALERDSSNFFEGITELWPGHNLIYDLSTQNFELKKFFSLHSIVCLDNDHLTDKQLIEKIRERFELAVRLRLRSDVEAGTCLSGGIDSSAIATTAARMIDHPLHCFTAGFRGENFDETPYASVVAKKIGAIHHVTEPGMQDFMHDLDELLYAQDVPIWDSSTYAQHRVMALSRVNGIKVVLDGQGADELFTGYHHHYTAKWNGLLYAGRLAALFREWSFARKSLNSPAAFFARERLKSTVYSPLPVADHFLKKEFSRAFPAENPFRYKNEVNDQLIDDITRTRLKIFLKCEDRCGMWHGVESRTPFSDDIELISLMFSFSGERKIRKGVLKYFLREAVKEQLPEKIYLRSDKKGFETPLLKWVGSLEKQMREEIQAASFPFVSDQSIPAGKSIAGKKLFFRLFILARWQKVFLQKV